jgi:hypothetical protein
MKRSRKYKLLHNLYFIGNVQLFRFLAENGIKNILLEFQVIFKAVYSAYNID